MKKLLIIEEPGHFLNVLLRTIVAITQVEITLTDRSESSLQLVMAGGFDCAFINYEGDSNIEKKLVKKLRGMKTATKLILMGCVPIKDQALQAGADAFMDKSNCCPQELRELFKQQGLL